jgi:hypothetical protein
MNVQLTGDINFMSGNVCLTEKGGFFILYGSLVLLRV